MGLGDLLEVERKAPCQHKRVSPEVCDQTLGVKCVDCNKLLAWCWGDLHASEELWNRACLNDTNAASCKQSRNNVCFLCNEKIPTFPGGE